MRDIGGHGSGRRRPPAPGPQWSGRPGPSATNGHSHHPGPGRPFDMDDADLSEEDSPIDLVELQADDELINALSSGLGVSGPGQQGYDANDRLVAMLASWRADVDAEPMPQLVEPDVAAEVLSPRRGSRRVSYLRPVIAAVAVAACGLGVLSVTAHEAQPGDSLWSLSKVLYSERAEQVQASADLRSGIDRINAKLASGDTLGAQRDLEAMGPLLAKVGPGGDLAFFDQQRQFLAAKVAETPPGTPTDPAAPLRNGTQAPLPPATEGSADPAAPAPGTSPQAPTAPAPGSSGPSGSTGPGSSDPRSLRGPEPAPAPGPVAPTPSSPTTSADPTSPTSEGTADDPSTTTTRPTASGDAEQQSATTSGGVSSTPR